MITQVLMGHLFDQFTNKARHLRVTGKKMYLRLVEKQCVKMVCISVSMFYEMVTV